MIAHVLSGTPVPLAVEWLAAVLLFAGIVGAMFSRRRSWRRLGLVAGGIGLVATATTWGADAASPGPAPYGLRIVAPRGETGPDAVFTVCGVRGSGSLLPPTDSKHWLAPFTNGRQVAAIDHVFPVRLSPGSHTVRFDLVTPSVQEYSPAATASQQVIVRLGAAASGPMRC